MLCQVFYFAQLKQVTSSESDLESLFKLQITNANAGEVWSGLVSG